MTNSIKMTQLNSENVYERYAKYDKRVADFIALILQDLEKNYTKGIPTSFISTFDLMATNLKLYFITADMLDEVNNPLALNKVKNTLLQTSAFINKLASSMGSSPTDKARIKRLNQTVDNGDELLEDLIS